MTKYILLVSIIFISCSHTVSRNDVMLDSTNLMLKQTDSMLQKNQKFIDSLNSIHRDTVDRVTYELNRIDSNRKYYNLAQNNDIKSLEMAAKYYQTGDMKYYRLHDVYDALRVKYAKICDKYSTSKYNIK